MLGRDNRILMLSLLLWALGEGLWLNLRTINMAQLGATPRQIGLVLAIGGVARTVLLIPGGWLADHYSSRKILLASWLMGIVAVIMMGLAPTWQWLIPGEALYGASIFVVPALSSYILRARPNHQQSASDDSGRVLTTVYASFSVGLIFSPPIGGLLADRFGIRSIFFISSGLFVLSTIVMLLGRPYKPDLQDERTYNWRSLLNNKSFLVIVALFFVMTLFMRVGWQFASVFLFDVHGYSLQRIGLLTGFFSAGAAGLSVALGRFSPRRATAAAQTLFWLAMLLFLLSGALPIIAMAFVLMGTLNTVHAMASASVAQKVPSRQHGTAFGIIELSQSIGITVASRIAGTLYETRPQLPFAVAVIALPLIIALSLIVLKAHDRRIMPSAQATHSAD